MRAVRPPERVPLVGLEGRLADAHELRKKLATTYMQMAAAVNISVGTDGAARATVAAADPEFEACVQQAVTALRLEKAAANASFEIALAVSDGGVLVGE